MAEEIKLLGLWASPVSHRVEFVLKLKGLHFQYIHEDIDNKSDLLLKSNPVHKKVPVLIHNGNPIAESLIIVEYIDETWTHNPVLPKDPYDRATARFWAKFVDETILPMAVKAFIGKGKEREEGIEELSRQLKCLEGELEGKKEGYFGGESIGFVDIAAFFILHSLEIMQEVMEEYLMTQDKFPVIFKWMDKLHGNDVVMECLPPREKHIDYARARRAATEEAASITE